MYQICVRRHAGTADAKRAAADAAGYRPLGRRYAFEAAQAAARLGVLEGGHFRAESGSTGAGSKTAYLEHSKGKITEEQLTAFMDAESWLTAAQCLEYGLCDRIGEAEVDEEGGGPMQAARIACMMGGVEQAGKIMAEISMLKKRIEALEQSGDDRGTSAASENEAREKKKRTCSAVMAAMRGMADGIK